MGLFSSAARVDSRLRSVLIGGTQEDLKRVRKAQDAILSALKPEERLIFVVADTHFGFVWAFTDQRLLETQGRSVSYDLALSKIAETELRHAVWTSPEDVRYCCFVHWRGGQLRALSGHVNSNGFLMLERVNGEDEARRIAELIDASLAESGPAPQGTGPCD